LAPPALAEIATHEIPWRMDLALVQLYCVVGGSVVAFAFWNNALRHWKTSQVYLFNNLIPLSNMAWAFVCLGEKITAGFWLAMSLIATGLVLDQADWQRLLGSRRPPVD
jgi:drug/metabolite transporter (DMT)-like permease